MGALTELGLQEFTEQGQTQLSSAASLLPTATQGWARRIKPKSESIPIQVQEGPFLESLCLPCTAQIKEIYFLNQHKHNKTLALLLQGRDKSWCQSGLSSP